MSAPNSYPQQNPSSEPIVLSQKVIPYLQSLGFRNIKTDVTIHTTGRQLIADAVVYLNEQNPQPYVVVEVKERLTPTVSVLDPAVQRAFTVGANLNDSVRYYLITDGNGYHWFEISEKGTSLIPLSHPPELGVELEDSVTGLIQVTDPKDFYRLIEAALETIRQDVGIGLRSAIEINKVVIAKLQDEQTAKYQQRRFISTGTTSTIKNQITELVREAVSDARTGNNWETWSIADSTLLNAVKILEPYLLSSVSSSVRGDIFWHVFPRILEGRYLLNTTPYPIAKFLVSLLSPRPKDKIIDPACGTGLFLIEAYRNIQRKIIKEGLASSSDKQELKQHVIGVERNLELARLAGTNLVLNGLSAKQIISANSLIDSDLRQSGVEFESFDLVILDPPVGTVSRRELFVDSFETAQRQGPLALETLFMEQAIKLLRPGGRLAILIPDSFLSLPSRQSARSWLLRHAVPVAIISLPPEAFAPLGYAGTVSVLLLEKKAKTVYEPETVTLVAELHNVGYDRFRHETVDNDLPRFLQVFNEFKRTGHVREPFQDSGLQIWSVKTRELSSKRLDTGWLKPAGTTLIRTVEQSQFPKVKLKQLADIIAGRHFKGESGEVTVVQAGAVRELEVVLSDPPRISLEEYQKFERQHIEEGDVLVTTTGHYLGRAAVAETGLLPAVASNAVTILRIKETAEVEPFYLAAVINSAIGKEQIERLQAASTAQPYIRRSDLSELLIPVPPLVEQKRLAKQIREKLSSARDFYHRARTLEEEAKSLVLSKLLGSETDE